MNTKRILILLCLLQTAFISFTQVLSDEERKLYDLVMDYRAQKGLPAIPVSPSLTMVAQIHVKDLQENKPVTETCNMHSWSTKGKWTACCYTKDHANANCMWSKPRELTSYKGNGYEISFMNSAQASAEGALAGWKSSPGHNAVIVNEGVWNSKWNAIGVGILGNYAVIWFGKELDNVEISP